MIKYFVSTTENGYTDFKGSTAAELKEFLYPNGEFADCCGFIERYNGDTEESHLAVAALKGYGVFLGLEKDNKILLSLSDKSKLSNTLDVWGDGLYVSEGLFIRSDTAWNAIEEYISAGTISAGIEWITQWELPEEGNYII